jgi:hypothetical protein
MHGDPWDGWSTGIRYSSGIFSFTFWNNWRHQCSWWGPSGRRHSYHNHVSIRTPAHYDTRQPAVVDNIYQHKGNKARVVAASRNTIGDRFSGTSFDRNQRNRLKEQAGISSAPPRQSTPAPAAPRPAPNLSPQPDRNLSSRQPVRPENNTANRVRNWLEEIAPHLGNPLPRPRPRPQTGTESFTTTRSQPAVPKTHPPRH